MRKLLIQWAAGARVRVTAFLLVGVMASHLTMADTVIIEGYTACGSPPAGSPACDMPTYKEVAGTWYHWSSAVSSAPGKTATKAAFTFTPPDATVAVTPTLANAGGTYLLEVAHIWAASVSTDVVMNVSVTGGVIKDAATNTSVILSTDKFQAQYGTGVYLNSWVPVGVVNLDPGVTQPTVTFSYASGCFSSSPACRIYSDGYRFTPYNDPCRSVADVNPTGPLAAGQTFVTVQKTEASAAAAITVYADGTQIGQLTSGIIQGNNNVPTSGALVRGQSITATQTVGTQEGCQPPPLTGPIVGGGANPPVRLCLNIREDTTLTGPVGADGGTASANQAFLGASGRVGVFGSAPSGGTVINPNGCWQTVTFSRAVGPIYHWAGARAFATDLQGDYGILGGIALAIEGTDDGPYEIYLDNVINGPTLIQDFESGTGTVMFELPGYSGFTQAYLMPPIGPALPNVGQVVKTTDTPPGSVDTGTGAFFASFQLKNTQPDNWCLLTTGGTGTPNPIVDLRKPISFRILMLPVGGTATAKPNITIEPVNVTDKCAGQLAGFTVAANAGADPITYQWMKTTDGGATYSDLAGETNPTYTLMVADDESLNAYKCRVTNAATTCFVDSRPAAVVLSTTITQQPTPGLACNGGSTSFSVTAMGSSLTYQWREDGLPLSDGNGISGATDSTLIINPVTPSRHGKVYTVDVTSCSTMTVTSADAVLNLSDYPPTPPTVTPSGRFTAFGSSVSIKANVGFTAQYWNSGAGAAPLWPNGVLPVLTRLDPVVDFAWGEGTLGTPGTPDPAVTLDHFIVRWQANVVAPATGNYTFHTSSDDGARLYVNGSLIIDHWVDQNTTEWCGPGTIAPGTCTAVPLTADQLVDLRLEYYENAGGAVAQLYWSGPGLDKQILNPSPGQWKKDGVPIPGATSGLYTIASMSGNNVGTYSFEYTDPCSGEIVVTQPVDLELSADFNGDHMVNTDDVLLFISCATGPDIPYTVAAPCKPEMDMDGDGDVDQTDFGRMQRQYGATE
ncbi:MAG TPA: PA14 domain-containing protein [Phycisphaerae bacterium]|nr:PA14 domain-containing protein [Phycisphaerae bacterium]HRY71537.1 PA14 domain-containing protein [Phycisphaerae bacterium]HSA30146.1 PA14 domain-containing protein [Phycisphaerae bacterium]